MLYVAATKSFTTLSTDDPSVEIALTGKTESSISISGKVIDEGGATITARGFVYKVYTEGANDPTITDGTIVAGDSGENGSFTGAIKENILPKTAYIIRAYATNNDHKTGYSKSITVTTDKLQVPSLTTGEASDLTAYSAMLHATFLSDNGFTVTERGFATVPKARRQQSIILVYVPVWKGMNLRQPFPVWNRQRLTIIERMPLMKKAPVTVILKNSLFRRYKP